MPPLCRELLKQCREPRCRVAILGAVAPMVPTGEWACAPGVGVSARINGRDAPLFDHWRADFKSHGKCYANHPAPNVRSKQLHCFQNRSSLAEGETGSLTFSSLSYQSAVVCDRVAPCLFLMLHGLWEIGPAIDVDPPTVVVKRKACVSVHATITLEVIHKFEYLEVDKVEQDLVDGLTCTTSHNGARYSATGTARTASVIREAAAASGGKEWRYLGRGHQRWPTRAEG